MAELSFCEPAKKRTKKQLTTMDISVEGTEILMETGKPNNSTTEMDLTFDNGDEGELSCIEHPAKTNPNRNMENPDNVEEAKGMENAEPAMEDKNPIKKKNLGNTISYADKTKGTNKQQEGSDGERTSIKYSGKQFCFSAEELMEMEEEVTKLQQLKDPVKWVTASEMSMKFINTARTTTIIYQAEKEALATNMKTPAMIKLFGSTTQSIPVQNVIMRKNILVMEKLSAQKIALRVTTKEDAAIMQKEPIWLGSTKFNPWIKPRNRLGNMFAPIPQQTEPEQKKKVKTFQTSFYATIFSVADKQLMYFLSYWALKEGTIIKSFTQTFADPQTGINSDTFRITFASKDRPECLYTTDENGVKMKVNRLKLGNRTIALIGSDINLNQDRNADGSYKQKLTITPKDISEEMKTFIEKEKTGLMKTYEELLMENDMNNNGFQEPTRCGPASKAIVEYQKKPITLGNSFQLLEYEQGVNEHQINDFDVPLQIVVSPKVKVKGEGKIPIPKITQISMDNSLLQDEQDALKYNIDYIETSDLEKVIKEFTMIDPEWIIEPSNETEDMGIMKSQFNKNNTDINTLHLVESITKNPFIYKMGLSDSRTVSTNSLQKLVILHAFQRSLADHDGLMIRTMSARLQDVNIEDQMSSEELLLEITKAVENVKSSHLDDNGLHIQKWNLSISAALIDIIGRIIVPKAWIDPTYMALFIRQFPGVLPIEAECYHYDDKTLNAFGSTGIMPTIRETLEKWNKKKLNTFLKLHDNNSQELVEFPLWWKRDTNNVMSFKLDFQSQWTSGNCQYDQLRQPVYKAKRL